MHYIFFLLVSHGHIMHPGEYGEIWKSTNDAIHGRIENVYCILEALSDLTLIISLVKLFASVSCSRMLV